MLKALRRQLARPLWFLLAGLFLLEAWLWDVLGYELTRLAALLPFEAFKRALARTLVRMPAPLVLLVFVIPVAIIEPFKLVGVWLITHHHVFFGLVAFAAAKVAGLGVVAFLFDMTRPKLLSMVWFRHFYFWMLRVRAWAQAILEPYKRRLEEVLAPMKARLREKIALFESRGTLARRLVLLRSRARRARRPI